MTTIDFTVQYFTLGDWFDSDPRDHDLRGMDEEEAIAYFDSIADQKNIRLAKRTEIAEVKTEVVKSK